MQNNSVPIVIGHGIGGGTAHNGLIYNRGNPLDYDNWSKMVGPDWSYEEVFPYFLKSEKLVAKGFSIIDYKSHSTKGIWPISGTTILTYFGDQFWRALDELKWPKGDYNSNYTTVFDLFQLNSVNGVRQSTGRAFLAPASFRPNLDVIVRATVDKIYFNDKNEAEAVSFLREDKKYFVKARKEIILSAGAYNSPKLLMLSGIGPRKELDKFGIKIVVDLPGVGENFQYHAQTNNYFSIFNMSDPTTNLFVGNVRTKYAPDSRPDILYEVANAGQIYDFNLIGKLIVTIIVTIIATISFSIKFFQSGMTEGYKRQLTYQYLDPFSFSSTFVSYVVALRCYSRGLVTLKSLNVYDQPIIDHRLYSDPRDLRSLIEGLKIFNQLLKTRALINGLDARPLPNRIPGCEKYLINTDPWFECLARTIVEDAYHPCCTNKMGTKNDPMAVVDPQLRVYGVKNLRVIDSSIMPIIPSGNLMAPTVMIAEKGSDMIKNSKYKSTSDVVN